MSTTTTRIRTAEPHVKLAAPQLPADIRSGGESRPLDYPHLYQIHAGDWRISYAVEHNRLAILVLEVLNPAGESSKDGARETLTQKMKIKLLDWPENSGHRQLPPEVVSGKWKIKWLDMAEEGEVIEDESAHAASRIKLKGVGEQKQQRTAGAHKITLLDAGETAEADDVPADESDGSEDGKDDRKVTPLDEPSM
ncbi:MAG TPA: hypothetical protein VF784_07590 [Anaerolineales bacterium]